MGSHKEGFVAVGAFVENKLSEYIDQVAQEHGFSTRSDAIRAILRAQLTFKALDEPSYFDEVIGDNNRKSKNDMIEKNH